MSNSSPVNGTIKLRDGRQLGFAEFGDPAGRPVIYCYGGIGSRLQCRPTPEQPLIAGLRLIGIDRPGMGLSDFQPKRRILDWPEDVSQLADDLEINQFSVLGVSSGGPYALACAYKIPERLTACGLVASAAPPDLPGGTNSMMRAILWVYRAFPWLTRMGFWWLYGRYARESEEELERSLLKPTRISTTFPEADRRLWSQTGFRRHALIDKREAFRQGTKGPAYEAGLWGTSWGFRLEEIKFEKMYLWHGELDMNSPASAAHTMAGKLPHCTVKVYPNEGHSVGSYLWEEILSTIVL